jgi:ribosomal protein S1
LLTTDSTIVKSKVIEAKVINKQEGKDRRRSRRLRRQLENVAAGDNVIGTVQKVMNEGILVTISSLGPLNITGLISKKDLPKHFEVNHSFLYS